MQKTKNTILALALAIAGSAATLSSADANTHMSVAGRTSQPIGHALFCQQFSQECEVRSNVTKAPKLTRKRWADLVEINNHINMAVRPVTDQDYYGVEEHWTYPKEYGDCEDYVLLKRYMLLQRGWPESSLLITVVKQPNGEGHAVLTVRTGRGDYILDNLEMKVKRWDKTPYKFLKRQSAKYSGHWTTIRDNRARVAGI